MSKISIALVVVVAIIAITVTSAKPDNSRTKRWSKKTAKLIEERSKSTGENTMSRRLRRKKLLAKFIASCLPALRKACTALYSTCQVNTIFKRSIDNDATIGRARSKHVKHRTIQIDVSCKLCKKTCWKRRDV